jgi:transposase
MLVALRLVEQRYQAVVEVLDGASVVDVARRFGVARQTVHVWLGLYAGHGLAGLADKSSRPLWCPHQMAPEMEARVVDMRQEHPGWGPRTIVYWLEREGFDPLPGRTSVERGLKRQGLVEPKRRRRRRADYRRWERTRSMELGQMDIMGGVCIADVDTGEIAEAKIVTGIDDHSRFVMCARVVARATARPVCDALEGALGRYGCPDEILSDNAKVVTNGAGSPGHPSPSAGAPDVPNVEPRSTCPPRHAERPGLPVTVRHPRVSIGPDRPEPAPLRMRPLKPDRQPQLAYEDIEPRQSPAPLLDLTGSLAAIDAIRHWTRSARQRPPGRSSLAAGTPARPALQQPKRPPDQLMWIAEPGTGPLGACTHTLALPVDIQVPVDAVCSLCRIQVTVAGGRVERRPAYGFDASVQ